nr:immunoglobulin light chain junction region [Macaca mulatta]MOV95534.1 immunoglobulin light chain junction region [Macaca mulatta]MOV96401.1 immunoglobulin light chain junction region [Macaca mulatta]MOV96862.1 immunoglobulin light chain junction region [Macaca mulatta]MOW00875.1 immunoglobulin light chain junction region [Macaca mulatta]
DYYCSSFAGGDIYLF